MERRPQSLVNVLESWRLWRKAKNKYTWHGIRMPAALQQPEGGAEEFGEDLILDGRDDEEEKDSCEARR